MEYDFLIEEHLQQNYGEFNGKLSVEQIIDKYALFPNEAIYIVDCKNAQMEPLTKNFRRITGIDAPHKNELIPLYEHVHADNLEAFLKYTSTVVKCGFDKSLQLKPESDFVNCLYLTHHKRVILKSTAILNYDSIGTMRYTIGKLMDVTGLIPFHHFGYKFAGPNKQVLYNLYNTSIGIKGLLSLREIEILRLIGSGQSSQDISQALFISRLTVEKHRRNILSKLETKSSLQAFDKAKNLGLL